MTRRYFVIFIGVIKINPADGRAFGGFRALQGGRRALRRLRAKILRDDFRDLAEGILHLWSAAIAQMAPDPKQADGQDH